MMKPFNLLFALMLVPSLSWSAPFFIEFRKSMLCAQLFTASVAEKVPQTEYRELAEELGAFNRTVLARTPSLREIQNPKAVRTGATQNSAVVDRVAARNASVVQSLNENSFQVIGSSRIGGEQRIQEFFERTKIAEKQIAKFKHSFSPLHLLTYEYYFNLVLVALVYDMSFVGLLSSSLTADIPAELALRWAYGLPIYSVVGLAGAFDMPIRFGNAIELGELSLSSRFKKFIASDEPWAYWSKDLTVTQGFVTALTQSKQVDWATLHDLNKFEQVPGIGRIGYWRDSQNPWYQPARFSIDVLFERTESGPEMRVVLRSTPLQTGRQKSRLSVGQGAPAAIETR